MPQLSHIPSSVLVDKRSWPLLKERLFAKMANAGLIGFDIETHDADRHPGLNALMAINDEGHKAGNKKLLFDTNRTTVTGMSLYFDGDDKAYYINLAHADVENRLSFDGDIRPLLSAKPEGAYWVSHKSPFELTMMRKSLGFDLGEKVICTLQLAVTAFNPDTYEWDDLAGPSLGGIEKLYPQIAKVFAGFKSGDELSNEQEELLAKVTAKESDAEHSYNGYVKSMAYGYGLKGLMKKVFGYEQTTFEQVLGGKAHMGMITGEQVASYGADDAWTCIALFHWLLGWIAEHNPSAMTTFFNQENPMCQVYSEVWGEGVRLNHQRIIEERDRLRTDLADVLRRMKKAIKAVLPYPFELHEKLLKYDSKFENNGEKYRSMIERFASMPDSDDVFTQVYQVRGPTSKAMAEERGKRESVGVNISYYMAVRSILYDLCGCSFQLSHGKVQSDREAQDKMRERWLKKHEELLEEVDEEIDGIRKKVVKTKLKSPEAKKALAVIEIIDCYRTIAEIEQSVKLYITNYLHMIDPDSERVYPVLSSQLATRRMALESPNASQLAKNSNLAYVRSFYEADDNDQVIVTADWSSVELVLIGEFSGDPGFAEAFGQLPYKDMHTPAAIEVLNIMADAWEALPKEQKKRYRTDLGKGANFNYWYSGALSTIGEMMGWSADEMWAATERYRARFPQAEAWRVSTIEMGRMNGYVQLPDGLIRWRKEATQQWAAIMRQKFQATGNPAIIQFGELVVKRVFNRAGNQMVNAHIQGSCATLAKRSILRMRDEIPKHQLRARFMFPVHDELVYSVHRDDVVRFKPVLREAMCNHPDIVKNLVLNCAFSVGNNYQAYGKKNPFGQFELDEWDDSYPIDIPGKKGLPLDDNEIQLVLDYLATGRQ